MLFAFSYVNAQFPLPYCSEAYSNAVEPITLVQIRGLNNATSELPSSPAHENFTSTTTSLIIGNTYPITVKGFTGGNFTNYIRVFVDWNSDNDFFDANESIDIGTITNSTGLDAIFVTGNITVPAGTVQGSKRMRVTKRFGSFQAPCNINGWGQAEDYTINVYNLSPYCTSSFPSDVEPITFVKYLSMTTNSSANINGTPENEDFTYLVAQRISPGRSFDITVRGNTNGNYTNYISVFVDWNEDYDFLDANENFNIGTITNSTGADAIEVIGTITVPVGTPLGFKRLRVTKRWGSYSPPCNNSGWGQSEDYTLKVFSVAPYCENDFPQAVEPITRVDFSAISLNTADGINTTAANEDFSNMNGIVVPGGNYTIAVKGNTNGNYTNYIRLFVDWNNDFDFLDANESYDVGTITNSSGVDAAIASAVITVPATATFGNKRMRVSKKFGSYPTPCENSGWGQSEDYSLTVQASVDAAISTGNLFLKGNYTEVGLNACGGWGTSSTTPDGYHARSGAINNIYYNNKLALGFVADPDKDGWATGSPSKYNGDYFMPQAPWIGWGVVFNGDEYGSERTNSDRTNPYEIKCNKLIAAPTGTPVFSGANIFTNVTGLKSEGKWEGANNGLKIQKNVTVRKDKTYFTATIKVFNTTASTINGVYYGEYVNPDNNAFYGDPVNSGTLNTNNTIVKQNPTDGEALVSAVSFNNIYLGLGSKDCRAKVFRELTNNVTPINSNVENWYNQSLPSFGYTGSDGNQSNNRFIGIAFNLGNLAAGDSTSFTYTYILKESDFGEALLETEANFKDNINNIVIPSDGTMTPCANSTTNVKILGGDFNTWTWSPATGLSTTTGTNVDITVGTTPITYTVTGVGSCGTRQIKLNVAPIDISNVTTTPSSVVKCILEAPVQITANGGSFTNAIVFDEKYNSQANFWDKINNTTGGTPANAAWTLRPNGYSYNALTFNSNDNSQFYLSNSDEAGSGNSTNTILKSSAFSTLNYSSAYISFYHFLNEPNAGLSTATIEISTNDATWDVLQTYTTTQGAANSFSNPTIALPLAYINQPTVYIRFKYVGTWRWYWAIDNVTLKGDGQPLVWNPPTGLFTDAAGTIPYTSGTIATTVYANPSLTTNYTVNAANGACTKTNTVNVIVNSTNNNLAGVVAAPTCQSKIVNPLGSVYNATNCNLIAKVTPSGGSAVSGSINTCVTLDNLSGPLPTYNAEPYLTRHFDILPTINPATSTATITLYFTQAEFDNYNAKNGLWPDLPANPADAVGKSNLRITQYHGTPNTTPSLPNQYSLSTGLLINPVDADIIWNGNFWEVSFNVTGFSGFYVHTNLRWALPVDIKYLTGKKNNQGNLLNWNITCGDNAAITMILERSGNNNLFNEITTKTTLATDCSQIFNYTDVTPLSGVNYYRLKVIDEKGKAKYSNVVMLINDATSVEIISLVPNPITATGLFKLNISSPLLQPCTIQIYDVQGRLMKQQNAQLKAGLNTIDMNAVNFAVGTYNIILSSNDKPKSIRFVKQ
ncbi:MAG: T9SS type A sorting domain-containing protein [Ferruginibacter sp.]|nr:T9SS type A sorting domain-containing protein [Ferruginibacter sp.]